MTDLFTGTLGFSSSRLAGAVSPDAWARAECVSLMSCGSSLAWTLLLLT